jgi:hypothetical protein
MDVYRNRRYEEDIVILMWHREGEQRMVETSKQKTQIQAHTSASVRPALGYWVKEGVGLVVHFSLEGVAKINTP